jgi:hypothetical protein
MDRPPTLPSNKKESVADATELPQGYHLIRRTLQLSGGRASFTEKVTCISRPLQLAVRRPDMLVDEFTGNHGQLHHPSEKD